jgi:23S rRNA pseudouridine1911/1915/1917 synthase
MHDSSAFTIFVDISDSGKRLDALVASRISGCSRSVAARLIRNGKIRVRGAAKKPGYRTRTGDKICGTIPPPETVLFKPEPIPIDIMYQDHDVIVLNKPPGVVVHPAPGHYSGTLVNALLYHCPGLEGIGGEIRPGIVHRLDKDTSGVMVVAKNSAAHQDLARQFKSRSIKKIYLALVYGRIESQFGRVSLPIGRHPVDRKKMSTHSRKSRMAETTWQVRKRFAQATLLEISLKTGRTHQIRVHCAAIKHAVVGDTVYGPRKAGKSSASDLLRSVPRQMLHAWRLEFIHPKKQRMLCFEAPIPSDMVDILETL